MELNKMLMHVDSNRQQEDERQYGLKAEATKIADGTDRSRPGKERNLDEQQYSKDSPEEQCHLETLYGTFAHYPIDNKAAQTLFEVY